ncbi:hypothetical protein BWQ96_03460 [Gracilariopsis chorda]|uniref:Uncharacterized protein n=1 Tax=Gracilariopsis chorda TaxID=448386 RepID=A0A2V3IXE0_9FLOR|nr:hypothetical protein BWQ96_03460 [Gracilariopsis chorda]|eukprot:PXF46769.1 hypothetical protein BWQ96_03460 [Gracilariopsis chorda]
MRRSQPFHLVSLCILSLTILHPVFAIPLRSAKHVPDHWAQLLEADRYSLIPSESWTTQSDIPASPTNRTSQLSYNLNPTARTKKFKGKGANSNFECHVHNAPPNINIQRVITKVVSICEQSWKSPQLVLMQVRFADLGVQENLANGGGTFFVRMKDTFNTVLPVAAAEAIRGRDLNGKKNGDGKYDVLVTVNTKTPWYDGDDGNVPNNQYDLVTVILHEVYHNVLFAGSIVAEVKRGDQYPGGVLQTASIYKDYRTRFDSFLVTRGGCPVLGYLSDQQLATDLGRSTNQLLADAVCNNQLYWGFNNRLIAKLHSPRVFMRKSSIYHFDPDHSKEEDSLMFPTVKIGIPQHIVGPTIIVMQQATLNPKILGANTACTKLPNPVPQTVPQQSDFEDPTLHAGFLVPPGLIVAEEGSVGGFPTWGIILLAILAFLLALLLLALCLMLCLRKRKNFSFTSPTSFFSSSRRGKTTSRSSSSYRSRHGHTTSATSKTSLSDFWGRSKKSSTKKSKRPATTTTTSHRPSKAKSSKDSYCKQTCPSSGKCIDKCYCVFYKFEMLQIIVKEQLRPAIVFQLPAFEEKDFFLVLQAIAAIDKTAIYKAN